MADPSFSLTVPEGDDIARKVCDTCGFVAYENPKIVVGSVVRHDGRILLCRRAIEPRRGFWTIPAGYLELNETPEDGARREAREEARATLAIERLLAVYSVPRISQVQLIYRASLAEPGFAAGPESLDVRLFAEDEIPYDELAFPSVHWALGHDREAEAGAPPIPFSNPDGETGSRMPSGERLGVDRM
ncbi:ADP-ribose pyrophosphatase YjhB, NUDIX family [Fulvimarina manganoxydans]|uniref:ADP-ribose pyrophosphatase YjhB, NUDIX family n=1 Tax=Fulvimarina manganoxydans TaxID=937218 RepID=A0A1W1YI48_9HYPH|nr:NUDIX hydrolase [Fulvimarina manganoxydans]SMC35471.1 ADP-ribose pyrophosphatase YjhB, NUDIX family [Fulvimarina manganoxydans]